MVYKDRKQNGKQLGKKKILKKNNLSSEFAYLYFQNETCLWGWIQGPCSGWRDYFLQWWWFITSILTWICHVKYHFTGAPCQVTFTARYCKTTAKRKEYPHKSHYKPQWSMIPPELCAKIWVQLGYSIKKENPLRRKTKASITQLWCNYFRTLIKEATLSKFFFPQSHEYPLAKSQFQKLIL